MKMKFMKKFLQMSFVAVLAVSLMFGLTACGDAKTSNGADEGKLTAQACEEC
jgi:uncharacterized lipoprotein YehR (DUF1307 family)